MMGAGLAVDRVVLVVAALVLGAVLTAAFAARPHSRFRVPGALLFLAIGMAVGSDGLGLVAMDDPAFVRDLGVVTLLVILFEGGLTTKPTDLRLAARAGFTLATAGVVVTAAITGVGAWALLDVDPYVAALIGAVVASTDAAAVFSMMRTTPLPRRVSALLRIESGANDPIAIILTVGLLTVLDGGGVGPGAWIAFAALQLVGGVLGGALVGTGGVWLLRRVELGVVGLYPVLAAAIGGVAYGLVATLGGSGFVAVYVAGVFVGSFVPRHRRSILGFHEAMANAAEIGLFLLLGLLVFPSRLPAVWLAALSVAAVLVLIARPVAVWLCTFASGLDWRDKTVVNIAGLRGAVPIVLATFPFTAGVAGGSMIFDVVFFVVLVSVLVQGGALVPVIRRLGVRADVPAWAPVAEALPLDGIDIDLVELFVTEDLALANRRLRDIPLLDATLVAAIVRDGRVRIAKGDTFILPGDVLLLTSEREGDVLARVTAWARGETGARGGTDGSDEPPERLR
jgi:potassium/hydrogen antiporter